MSNWMLPRITDYWDARSRAVFYMAERLDAISGSDREAAMMGIHTCIERHLDALSADQVVTLGWIMSDDLYCSACELSHWDVSLTEYLRASARPVLRRLTRLGYHLRYYVDNQFERTPVGMALPAQFLGPWFGAAGFAYICPHEVAFRRIRDDKGPAENWTDSLTDYLPHGRASALDALSRCETMRSHFAFVDPEWDEPSVESSFEELAPGAIFAFRNESPLVSARCMVRVIPSDA